MKFSHDGTNYFTQNGKTDPVLNHFQFYGGWDNWCIQQGAITDGFRLVAEDPTVHEDFFGLYQTDTIDAKTLVHLIKDMLFCINLS